jgi:hypothetical protein
LLKTASQFTPSKYGISLTYQGRKEGRKKERKKGRKERQVNLGRGIMEGRKTGRK